ncbi:MAG: hypothetical protein EZS28_053841, partial [Streblomastix strix]
NNAEIQIYKRDDNYREFGKQGWISAFDGLQLEIYSIDIITDSSTLYIPVIYVKGDKSSILLESMKFSDISLLASLLSNGKGIIHLQMDDSQFKVSNCTFQNIDIVGSEGNAIRIAQGGEKGNSVEINSCKFIDIVTNVDESGIGGSALYIQSGKGDNIIINQGTQFTQCICNGGDGGAIYAKIEQNSSLEISGGVIFELRIIHLQMNNAEIQIYKRDDNYREFGKQGWISAFDGLQLEIYSIDIITDS